MPASETQRIVHLVESRPEPLGAGTIAGTGGQRTCAITSDKQEQRRDASASSILAFPAGRLARETEGDRRGANTTSPHETNGEISTAGEEVPQASFLGLPPEMTLRVYDYLFPRIHQSARCDDCWKNHEADGKIICRCHPQLQPSLLSTNKLICREASPVFYSSIELCSPLPIYGERSSTRIMDKIKNQVPESSLAKIGILTYVTSLTHFPIYLDGDDDDMTDAVAPLWSQAIATLPNLVLLRLRIATNLCLGPSLDFRIDVSPISGLLAFPKLHKMELDVYPTRCFPLTTAGRSFGKGLRDVLAQESIKLGRDVEIITLER